MKLTVLAFFAIAFVPSAHAASFDCAKARAPEEFAVCADPQLSALDGLLGTAFAQAKKISKDDQEYFRKLMAVANVFLASRHACGARRPCLAASYAGALEGYVGLGSTVNIPGWIDAPMIADGKAPASRSLPTIVGTCTSARVDSVTPRLGDGGPIKPSDFDSGTAINFDNGGTQVSYDREPALLNSRRGDPVVMCLISVPQLCPPGDDRGRAYLVTNMRTRQTWTLGDSEHMCGGA